MKRVGGGIKEGWKQEEGLSTRNYRWKLRFQPYTGLLTPSRYDPEIYGESQNITRYLREGIAKHPQNFGIALGFFVGILKFRPKEIFRQGPITQLYIACLNSLKNKPMFYEFIKIKIIKWNKKIQPIVRRFVSGYEERDYLAFMKTLT